MNPDAPEITGNRAARRAAGQRGRKLAALGSGAVLATGVAAGAVASFATSAGAATTIAVQNTNDSGAGSLRQALADANAGDTIDLTGVSGTITLTSGQLEIDDAVTITGPGASVLTVSGNHASRVFQMDEDLSGGTVTISGITITNGNAGTKAHGGGISFYCDGGTGSLVIDSAVVTGNTADWLGGGLYFDDCDGSNLTILNSTFSYNTSATSGGGAIWFDEGDALTIQNSTLDHNHAAVNGGALYFDDGQTFTMTNSTVSANAAGEAGGGVVFSRLDGNATLANSTISGNDSGSVGGGVAVFGGTLALEQTTISGNTAVGGGDGLYFGYFESGAAGAAHAGQNANEQDVSAQAAAGSPSIIGSIVAGNADATDDIASGFDGALAATSTSSVLGAVNNVDITGTGNQSGVTDPGLDPLANNGGATATMALKAGSVAIDKGPDPVPSFPGNEFDQRGAGYARVVNGKVDVGAFEVQAPAPAPEVIVTPKFTG